MQHFAVSLVQDLQSKKRSASSFFAKCYIFGWCIILINVIFNLKEKFESYKFIHVPKAWTSFKTLVPYLYMKTGNAVSLCGQVGWGRQVVTAPQQLHHHCTTTEGPFKVPGRVAPAIQRGWGWLSLLWSSLLHQTAHSYDHTPFLGLWKWGTIAATNCLV